jgi:hypothetical protein
VTDLPYGIATISAAVISGVAAIKASKAEKNSRPVSNGFADGIRTDVREIRSLLIEHIKDHNKN